MSNEKLKKLLRLTKSDNDGEALAALRKFQELIPDWHKWVEGLSFHQAANPFKTRVDEARGYTWDWGTYDAHAAQMRDEIFRWAAEQHRANQEQAGKSNAERASDHQWGRSTKDDDALRQHFKDVLEKNRIYTWTRKS